MPHPLYVIRPDQRIVVRQLMGRIDAALGGAVDNLGVPRLREVRAKLRSVVRYNSWAMLDTFLADWTCAIEYACSFVERQAGRRIAA